MEKLRLSERLSSQLDNKKDICPFLFELGLPSKNIICKHTNYDIIILSQVIKDDVCEKVRCFPKTE